MHVATASTTRQREGTWRGYQAPFAPLVRTHVSAPTYDNGSNSHHGGRNGASLSLPRLRSPNDASSSLPTPLHSNVPSRLPTTSTPSSVARPHPHPHAHAHAFSPSSHAHIITSTPNTSHNNNNAMNTTPAAAASTTTAASSNITTNMSNARGTRRLGTCNSMPALLPSSHHHSPSRSPRSVAIIASASSSSSSMNGTTTNGRMPIPTSSSSYDSLSKSPYHGRQRRVGLRAALPSSQKGNHKRWHSSTPTRTTSSLPFIASPSTDLKLTISGRELRTVTIESTRYETLSIGVEDPSSTDHLHQPNGQLQRAGLITMSYVTITLPSDALLQQISTITIQCWSRHDGSASTKTASLSWAELHVDTGGVDERSAYADLQARVFRYFSLMLNHFLNCFSPHPHASFLFPFHFIYLFLLMSQ
jgi:hypothetical protein